MVSIFELRVILDELDTMPTEERNKLIWNNKARKLEQPVVIPPVPEFTTPLSQGSKKTGVKVEPGSENSSFRTASSSSSSSASTTSKKRKQASSGAEDSGAEKAPKQKELRTVSVSSGGTEEDDDSDVVEIQSSDDESNVDKVRSVL